MNTMTPLRRRIGRFLLAGFFAAMFVPAQAQDNFPTKPITLVVPFAAGGGLDVTARILAEKLKDVLGQPVLISNRPGAGSAVGARAVATSAPDGHTLFITSGSAFGFLHLLVPNFELGLDNFVPVAGVASNPSIIVASTSVPARTLPQLVEYARSKPNAVSFCSTGANGLNHLQLEMFKRIVKSKTGSDFTVTHVPYNGLAPALIGVKDQSVQACTLPYTALVKNMDGKDLRILAVQRAARLPFLPNVATTGELGYPEMDGNDAFINLLAPKGTPPSVVAKLEGALRQVIRDPGVIKKLEDLDVAPLFMSSQEMRKWLEDDVKRFSTVIREAGLAAK